MLSWASRSGTSRPSWWLSVSPLQAALGYCLACPEIDKGIVGCERPEQWEGILEAAQATVSPESLRSLGRFAIHDEAVINPSRWN